MVASPSLSPCARRQGFEPISPPPGTAGSPPSYAAYYGKAELLGKVKELPEVAEGSSEEEEELERELVEKKVTGTGVSGWRLHRSIHAGMLAAGCESLCKDGGCIPPPFKAAHCIFIYARILAACLHPRKDASCVLSSMQ